MSDQGHGIDKQINAYLGQHPLLSGDGDKGATRAMGVAHSHGGRRGQREITQDIIRGHEMLGTEFGQISRKGGLNTNDHHTAEQIGYNNRKHLYGDM